MLVLQLLIDILTLGNTYQERKRMLLEKKTVDELTATKDALQDRVKLLTKKVRELEKILKANERYGEDRVEDMFPEEIPEADTTKKAGGK